MNGAGSRPGCTNQHSPVPPLVTERHIASATSSGASSGNAAAWSSARYPSTIGVSASPGHTAFNRMGASCGAMLRTNPTTACFVSE